MKGSLASLESFGVITQPGFLLELRNGARCVPALCAPPTEAASRVPSSPRAAPQVWEHIKEGLIFKTAMSHFPMELRELPEPPGAAFSPLQEQLS